MVTSTRPSPPQAADTAPAGQAAAAARDTLGGAVDVAAGLPGQPGAELLEAAHAAFAPALQLSAILGCATALCTAAAMVALLSRRLEPASEGRANEPGIGIATPHNGAPARWTVPFRCSRVSYQVMEGDTKGSR